MRLIDVKGMEIISSGIPWNHAISPCSKQAIHLLERNTKVVTWLMQTGGDVKDQIPCILYKGKYFSLSLRMQKAIYRHIRLKKGFKNEETVDGMPKLRIPDVLLREKMRTQSRFDAMRNSHKAAAASSSSASSANEKRERTKSINTVAARMKQVVEKMIASQKDGESRPQVTTFLYKSQQSEIIASFLNEMRKENINLFNNRSELKALIMARYDELAATLNSTESQEPPPSASET